MGAGLSPWWRRASLLVVTEPEERWLSSQEAADLLGLPLWRVRHAARTAKVTAEREPGWPWRIERASLLAWAMSVPYPRRRRPRPDRYWSGDRRPHVELLESLDLSDEAVAAALVVRPELVVRWHEFGVANLYVARLEALAERQTRPSG